MALGWTGKTLSPVDHLDLLVPSLIPVVLGTRVRRENASDRWEESSAQMMMLVRTFLLEILTVRRDHVQVELILL